MRKTIFVFGIVILLGAVFITLCGKSIRHTIIAIKPDYAVMLVNEPLLEDSSSAYAPFKQQAMIRLSVNERMLVRIKAQIDGGRQIKARYFNLLVELRLRNDDLKSRVLEYRQGKLDNWMMFEHNFTEDMDQLGDAIRNFSLSEEMMI